MSPRTTAAVAPFNLLFALEHMNRSTKVLTQKGKIKVMGYSAREGSLGKAFFSTKCIVRMQFVYWINGVDTQPKHVQWRDQIIS